MDQIREPNPVDIIEVPEAGTQPFPAPKPIFDRIEDISTCKPVAPPLH